MVTKIVKSKPVKLDADIHEEIEKLGFVKSDFLNELAREKLKQLKQEKLQAFVNNNADLYYKVDELVKNNEKQQELNKRLEGKVNVIGSILKRAKYYADPSEEDPHTEIHMHPLDSIELDKIFDEPVSYSDSSKKKK